MAKAIMIQGTMSNAGKSLITAGLCRIFKQDGYRTAPFKSQNMALNSFITEDGLEMGRAQVVQAEAAGVRPDVSMNPILLKPTTDVGSQVIVNGVPIGNMKAKDYFQYKKNLVPEIRKAYRKLDKEYDIIVIEGAGSPAEINLKQDDIVNMGMARLAGAPVLLVGDIDRGGVFAQLYGTIMLLEERERQMVKGLIINKFRGDKSILEPGVKMIEELLEIPVAGVTPYLKVDIEDEDSLSGSITDYAEKTPLQVDIAVIRVPRISNFTDFQIFSCMPEVRLRYVAKASELKSPDFVILPGTKNTIDDLLWLRQNGLEGAILKLAGQGVPIFGICGGYQMLGESLLDEEGVESSLGWGEVQGIGLLPVRTVYESEKTRTRVTGTMGRIGGVFESLSGMDIEGYEIHMGKTIQAAHPFSSVCEYQSDSRESKRDGCCKQNIYGTYIHGIFDKEGIADTIVKALFRNKGMDDVEVQSLDYQVYKEQQFDLLAEGLRKHLDMDRIYKILNDGLQEKKG